MWDHRSSAGNALPTSPERSGRCSSPPLNGQSLVIPVVLRSRHIHISIDSSAAHHSALAAYGLADFERRHKPLGSLSLHSSAAGSRSAGSTSAACTSASASQDTHCPVPRTPCPYAGELTEKCRSLALPNLAQMLGVHHRTPMLVMYIRTQSFKFLANVSSSSRTVKLRRVRIVPSIPPLLQSSPFSC